MIHSQRAFQAMPPAQFDGQFHWDLLTPAFRREGVAEKSQIKPMDFDAVVEVKGRFLIFETKQPGKAIPVGQRRTLERMASHGNATVIFLEAKTPTEITGITGWTVFGMDRRGEAVKSDVEGDFDALLAYLRRWFLAADNSRVSEAFPPGAPVCINCNRLLNGPGISIGGYYYHRHCRPPTSEKRAA